MNYDKLVAALRCANDGKLPCDNKECPYWVDQWHGIGLCNILKKHADAADAIEALQAEQEKTVTQIFGEEQQKWEEYCAGLMSRIRELKAQMQKLGEWELIDGVEPMRWGCSQCKYLSWETSNYCPRCGAKMEVQE